MSVGNVCYKIWCWFIMLLLWFSIIFAIIIFTDNESILPPVAIFLLIVSYVAYIVTNCFSSTCKFLFSKKQKTDSIHELMRRIFYNPPKVTFNLECFHYETRSHTTRDSKGRTTRHTKQVKVVTYSEDRAFNFYTWRDTSGLFLLDTHKIFRSCLKTYIKLNIDLEVEFADDITKFDYFKHKDELMNENKHRDTHINVREINKVEGLETYNMIRITDTDAFGVNKYFFLIFLILIPFMEFYKMYVDLFCIHQDYKVKKLISSRYNVNSPEYANKWEQNAPRLSIFNQAPITFECNPFPMHNNANIPSLDEIEQAKNNFELYEKSHISLNSENNFTLLNEKLI